MAIIIIIITSNQACVSVASYKLVGPVSHSGCHRT